MCFATSLHPFPLREQGDSVGYSSKSPTTKRKVVDNSACFPLKIDVFSNMETQLSPYVPTQFFIRANPVLPTSRYM
jgi:hypothetical protein